MAAGGGMTGAEVVAMTPETVREPETYPWDAPEPTVERSVGPRVRSEIQVAPETNIEPYDYGTGCHLWIGVPHESYVMVQLGWDEASRRDACDRLIAALTTARDYVPTEPVE